MLLMPWIAVWGLCWSLLLLLPGGTFCCILTFCCTCFFPWWMPSSVDFLYMLCMLFLDFWQFFFVQVVGKYTIVCFVSYVPSFLPLVLFYLGFFPFLHWMPALLLLVMIGPVSCCYWMLVRSCSSWGLYSSCVLWTGVSLVVLNFNFNSYYSVVRDNVTYEGVDYSDSVQDFCVY